MHGQHKAQLIAYLLFALLVVSSVILAMPGAFSPTLLRDTGTPVQKLPKGQYRMNLGDTVSVQGIQFTFVHVENDNRCHAGAICDQGGHAIITMHVTTSGLEEDIKVDSEATTYYTPFSIRLIELTPRPAMNETTAQAVMEIINTAQTDQ